MAKRPVIVEVQYTPELAAAAARGDAGDVARLVGVPEIAGVEYDASFPPTPIPSTQPNARANSLFNANSFEVMLAPSEATYVVRALIDEEKVDELRAADNVVGVFSDPVIETQVTCGGSAPVGSDADVERLLCTAAMRAAGMDGSGVLVAIVDTGINMAYLNSRGKNPQFDAARSWVPFTGLTPGQLPVGHGTMCAYDVCIAAPNCTLLDIALLQSNTTGPTLMSGFLSDGVRAYRHLISVMSAATRPGVNPSLVVNNSWAMFHPSWDFPPGNPGNYSDNPNHPFNRIVATLEQMGADIIFAAGNCGADCPDGRCQGISTNAIYGANSHPAVLSVAGVEVNKVRVGYSVIGPGRLTVNKPDISGYTHFRGSQVYAADGGTSAAAPVVAGVVAAVRGLRPYDKTNPTTHPAAIRSLLATTAEDLGSGGYDFEHGYGVVNSCELVRRLAPKAPKLDLPIRFRVPPIFWNFCERFPRLCDLVYPFPPIPPLPIPPDPPWEWPQGNLANRRATAGESTGGGSTVGGATDVEAAYLLGYMTALQERGEGSATATAAAPKNKSCGCGCK